ILSLLCSQTPIGTLFPYTTLFRSADVAQALRENQVGARGAERGLVDLIQGAAGTDPFSNHAARVTARLAVILQKGMAYDWFLPDRMRIVAFRRYADEVIAEAQRETDFGRRGEKRDNPHRSRRAG